MQDRNYVGKNDIPEFNQKLLKIDGDNICCIYFEERRLSLRFKKADKSFISTVSKKAIRSALTKVEEINHRETKKGNDAHDTFIFELDHEDKVRCISSAVKATVTA